MNGHTLWAFVKENGCIDSCGISRHPPDGHIPLPEAAMPADADLLMYVDGLWEARPEAPAPVVAPDGFTIPDCPAGARCEVFDVPTDAWLGAAVESDGTLTLQVPDTGTYRAVLEFPEPFVPQPDFTFTVEAAP
jgi:hypothetical protein